MKILNANSTNNDSRILVNDIFDDFFNKEMDVDYIQKTLCDIPFDCTMNYTMSNALILAMVKYDLIAPNEITAIDCSDEHKESLFDKMEELTYKDNCFLDEARSNENLYAFLLKCIVEPQVIPLLKYINSIYNLVSHEFLKDMFCTLATVLDPLTYVSILGELYIAHIFKSWDENTYSFSAIFNLLFKKESIERMFIEIMYENAPYQILTTENQNLTFRMMKAIDYLNNYKLLVQTTYDEKYEVHDIFNVDEYIETAIRWLENII